MSHQVRNDIPNTLTYNSTVGEQINSDGEDNGLFTNRSVMMANFEEWIKMATDNKINSRNSWNFALIDYFYDLNVLRDSENNINFQKASATLDGCVKIYSSRVDSVSNETGKLLSGLAQRKDDESSKKNKKSGNDNNNGNIAGEENGASGSDESVHIDPVTGLPVGNDIDRTRKRVLNRVLETTLVEFDSIKLKELDQDFHVDPLFKKAMAEFDESGAKSLLLNTLNVDNTLKVIFDAKIKESDDHMEAKQSDNTNREGEEEKQEEVEGKEDENVVEDTSVLSMESSNIEHKSLLDDTQISTFCLDDEILSLGMEHIKFGEIASSEISPSIRELRNVINNTTEAKSFVESLSNKFDKFLTEEELRETIPKEDENDEIMDSIEKRVEHSFVQDTPDLDDELMDNNNGIDDYNNEIPDMDTDNDNADVNINIDVGATSLGGNEGNLANANKISDANTSAFTRVPIGDIDTAGMLNEEQSLMNSMLEEDLMAYFDDNLSKNWRGREHWKVRNFKKIMRKGNDTKNISREEEVDGKKIDVGKDEGKNSSTAKVKKEFEIDFFQLDSNFEESIFQVPKKISTIELPHRLRINKSHYLLPDDYHFTTDKITRLFIKPRQHMSLFSKTASRRHNDRRIVSLGKNPVIGGREEGRVSIAGESQMVGDGQGEENQIANEEFWAENYRRKEQEELEEQIRHDSEQEDGEDILVRDPENPFDDYNGDVDFNQAFADEEVNPGVTQMEPESGSKIQPEETAGATNTSSFKSEDNGVLATQDTGMNGTAATATATAMRSSKLAYSRVSKKVNVRKLKDNVWSSLSELVKDEGSETGGEANVAFSKVVKGLTSKYSTDEMRDISTSFSFICLLHLANEHGFEIENCDDFEDLTIKCSIE